MGSLTLLDEPVRDYVQDHKGNTTERIANAFEPFGAEYAIGALAGFAAFGTLGGKPAARNVALDGTVSSLIAAGLVVPALKELTGRSRPNAGLGAHDFNPFSGAELPVGPYDEAFALATSIAQNYDQRWIKGLAYGVAGLVGYARVEHDTAHLLSDVTAAAFIGIGVAKEVSALHRARRAVVVTPLPVPSGWGVRVSAAF